MLGCLSRGEADLVVATIGITPERAALVDFRRPYFHTAIAVVVRGDSSAPRRFEELAGRSVGASRGTTSERALLAALPDALPVLDRPAGVGWEDLLLDGQIDAACMDGPDATRLVREHAGTLRRLQPDLAEERYAIAVAKGSATLVAAINRTIE